MEHTITGTDSAEVAYAAGVAVDIFFPAVKLPTADRIQPDHSCHSSQTSFYTQMIDSCKISLC